MFTFLTLLLWSWVFLQLSIMQTITSQSVETVLSRWWGVPEFLQTSHLAFRPRAVVNLDIKAWGSFRCLLANSKWAVMYHLLRSGFIWPSYHKDPDGWELQRWLFFWKVLQSPQRSSRAVSYHRDLKWKQDAPELSSVCHSKGITLNVVVLFGISIDCWGKNVLNRE